jgi:uncharacterized protein YecE (DUF72 family)
MRLYCGTSGFAYDQWKGAFYPPQLRSEEMLAYYAARLDCVEINNTFYRMPSAETIAKWAAAVPASFRFVLKASQRISHRGKLRGDDAITSMLHLWKMAATLEGRLAAVLIQTSPYQRKDLGVLREFLTRTVVSGQRVAFELQHPSWNDDETDQLLADFGCTRCIADKDQGQTRIPLLGSWAYLRLRRETYSEAELAAWLELLATCKIDEGYVFFKHEDTAAGVLLAIQLARLVRERAAVGVC